MTYDNFLKLLDEFEEIQSFAKKIEFANQYFQRIGSGSGRIVYDIDGTKVFKLAKNAKGVAQNEAEINIGSYHDTHNIVTKVLESNNNGSWIISEKAKKVNESRIKQLTGIPSLNELYYFLRNHENNIKGGHNIFGLDTDIEESLNNNEFVTELQDIMSNYSVSAGDLGRPSTYGEVLRDGQPTIVLTDYGLTGEVYASHYSPDRKNKPQYRMYELYDNYDGNDDILGDMPPQDAIDTRRGMWAQLPYSVCDGSGVINEGFISFILDRDKYPTRVLPSAPYIVDEFHNCVNNIDETLNHVKNKKKFYEKLLKLQEYLIEQKFYDREPLGEIVCLNEDGSALYSTDNAMGQDNFPVHNNIDTSPSIRNDLDANRDKNNEDLEYHNVVGDATKDQYMLDERQLSSMAGSSTVEVKKKCRLAGNGNTSTACNQGDINNLNIKPLKEAQNPEFTGYNTDMDRIEQSEKSYLNKVRDSYVTSNTKYLESYLTPEEMQIVNTWIVSDFKTGDRDDDKDAYTVRNKGAEALQKADPQTYEKYYADVKKYLDTYTKVRKFFMQKKFDLDKKYPGDARFGMAGDINVSEVSHFTTTDGAIDILGDGYIMQNDEGGVSTTSNKNLVKDINPVFYHPQSSGYEGVTYKNLSTQFVLNFNKIKADGIKFKKGNENRGTHIGEDEIRIYPEDGELDVYKYLKKVIIDSKKKQNPESYNKLIEILKEKNIQYFIKNESQNPDIIQEIENPINIHEEISASEAYTDQGAIKTVLNGKRNVGFVHINKPIAKILEKRKIGVIPVRMTSQNTMTAIIYRDKVKAFLLYEITKRNGGYLKDKTPEEAREIGRLLEYKEEDINDFIRKNYGNKVPLMPDKSPDDFNDLAEEVSYDFWDLNEENFPEFEKDIQQDLTTHQLDKKYIRSYQDGNITYNVYAVNGDEIRDSGFIEWVDGGNHWVDADLSKDEQKYAKHIPENEYWVDDVFMIKPDDFEAILLHERIESFIIRHYGYEYDDAHEIANKVEMMFRKKIPDGANRAIAEKIYGIFVANFKPEKSKEKHKPVNEGIADIAAEKQFGIEPPHQGFEDKFNREEKEDVVYVSPTNNLVIIRNPKSLNDIGDEVRGVIDLEGNLYTEQKTSGIHFDILTELNELGLIEDEEGWAAKLPTNFVTVQRYIKTNKYCLGESNYSMYQNMSRRNGSPYWEKMPTLEEATPVYQKFLDRAKQKNPRIEFINEPIQYYVEKQEKNAIFENEMLNEGQIMALNYLPFKEDVEEAGGKIYSVGGAVRDEFLGKESKDLDILITGVPFEKLEEILSKYGAVNAVGKSFGVLKFKPKGATEDIDIAIPRTETPTGEGGHQGFDVKSDHALPIEKDLERRDFTINAIAKDIDGNIVDPFGGQEDLKNGVIKIVNPQAFSDDPLRMLRAVQFASRFGFKIEPETMKMIQENAGRVKEIAPERILTEFDKIVKKCNILTGAILLNETGLLKEIFGRGLNYDFRNTREPFDKVRTMGEFVYLLSKNLVNNPAEFYKNNLKGDENSYKEIKALQLAYESGEATNLIEARSIAHNMYVTSPTSLQSQILPNVIKTAAQELFEGKYPKTVNELAVNGNDLMELGLQGKAVGDMQKSLLLKIYSNKVMNNKEDLLSLAGQNGK